MAIGQKATKQTWPLDNIEVHGFVRSQSSDACAEVGVCREFDVCTRHWLWLPASRHADSGQR
jgi:hypothetical protein